MGFDFGWEVSLNLVWRGHYYDLKCSRESVVMGLVNLDSYFELHLDSLKVHFVDLLA